VRWLTVLLTLALLSGCLKWQETAFDYSGEGVRSVAMLEGMEIHYAIEGPVDGTPVVLVHGFGSQLGCWNPLVPALDRDHRVLRMDLTGFGRSSRYSDGDYSREGLAALVLAMMDHVGMERAVLVGHSMGTAVVLTVALQEPERVERLVLAAPWLYEDQVPWGLRDARRPGVGEMIFGIWFTEHLDWRFRLSFDDPDRFVSEEMLELAERDLKRIGTRAAALEVIRRMDLTALAGRIPEVTQSTLVVACDEDVVARTEYAERLASELPRATLARLAECGHFPMIERIAAFNELVRSQVEETP
jgi:aminoacrylate hydrolase